MARGGKRKPIDLAGWAELNEHGRNRVVQDMRPVLREVARSLGTRTTAEQREVLEAIGISALLESGWNAVFVRPELN